MVRGAVQRERRRGSGRRRFIESQQSQSEQGDQALNSEQIEDQAAEQPQAIGLEQIDQGLELQGKKQWKEKQKRPGLEYLSIYEYISVKPNSMGTKILVKCSQCNKAYTYLLSQGTTSNLLKHAREHGYNTPKNGSRSAIDDSGPYKMYTPERLKVLRGIIIHLLKAKLPLNHIQDPHYRYLLETKCSRFRAPSRFWLTNQAVPAAYKKTKQRLKLKFEETAWQMAITSDGWKNRQNVGFNTLTCRYVVKAEGAFSLHEKLVDFKSYVGQQTGEVVLAQLMKMIEEIGLFMAPDLPLYITSDRGSNILKAIQLSEKKIMGIPCFSHVIHRAVLATMEEAKAFDCVQKVVKMSTLFKQSIPLTSSFQAFQRSRYPSAFVYITASKTRWHGYQECIQRYLFLLPRLKAWLDSFPNPNLNLDQVRVNILDEEEIQQISALCYVLLHIRPFDSVAQATTQGTGIKYARMIHALLDRLLLLQTTPEQTEQMVELNVIDSANREIVALGDLDGTLKGSCAKVLHEEIAMRFQLDQIKETILVLAYFDPFWVLTPPVWAMHSRYNKDAKDRVKNKIRKTILMYWTGYLKYQRDRGTRIGDEVELFPATQSQSPTAQSGPSRQSNGRGSGSGQGSGRSQNRSRTRVDMVGTCEVPLIQSQETPDRIAKKRKAEQRLDVNMFAHNVRETTYDFDIQMLPPSQREICKEMKEYERNQTSHSENQAYLDPLMFWTAHASQYPCLFKIALKMLSVPATSVLSEQVFSGAGKISTSERANLTTSNVEQLVFLQRSLERQDVDALTAEDFRVERQNVMLERKKKMRQEAYDRAIAQLQTQQDAYQAGDDACAQVQEANDEQVLFAGAEALDVDYIAGPSTEVVNVDDALREIFPCDSDDDLEDVRENFDWVNSNVTRLSRQWRRMTQAERNGHYLD